MKLFTITLGLSALLLTGCASTSYQQYADTNLKIQTSKANAEKARYKALEEIAKTGDANTRNMAVMALALGSQGNSPTTAIEAPRDPLLQWAGILVPSLTTIGVKAFDVATTINASDNNVRTEAIRYGTINNIAVEGIKGAKLPLSDIALTPLAPQ